MILFCSVVFWVGLFGLFLGGFEFIGLSDELFHAIFEYLFSMFFLSISIMLFFSTGIITYTALFHSREGAFLLIDAGVDRPDLRLQVRRGGRRFRAGAFSCWAARSWWPTV